MTHETFKGGIHALTGGLAAAMCLYNLMSYSQRRERHLAVNVGIYAALWAFEGYQAKRHWGRA